MTTPTNNYMKAARYFAIDLSYQAPGKTFTSGYGASQPTLDLAVQELVRMMKYYQDLGYTITGAHVTDTCGTCNGTGEQFIPYKRNPKTGKRIPCTACKKYAPETRTLTLV